MMNDIPWAAILGTLVTMAASLSGSIVMASKRFIAYQEQSAAHERDMERLRYERNARMADGLIETSSTLKDAQVIQASVVGAMTQTAAVLTEAVSELAGAESARCLSCERANRGSGELLVAIRAVGEQVEELGRGMDESYGSLITILAIPAKK